ncbi:DoxX family protein [Chryseotalea sanaruensis]|uniref:DoxX family protein n=1 Tax=Chryseotalea sanaruensis TaxID=2482724 RepID=A0A401U978_9BACT|nr:DoxX family membrane protein [Chryseotalea sanaruensis]GCC51446.1 DoxX family protein [Chryseotalea sanaruensis]
MKNKIFSVLYIIMGLLFINGGLNKFFNYMPPPDTLPEAMVKDFMAILEISWLMPLIGAAEILGGLLITIPKTRALGTLVLFPVVVGILLTHIFVEPTGLPIALIIVALIGKLIYDNRVKYAYLLN